MRQDLVEQLTAALSELTRKRLLGYAYKLISKVPWPGEGDLRELAQDVVSEAVCKAITDVRQWNPAVTPDVIDFLFSSVRSIVDAKKKNDRNDVYLTSFETPAAGNLAAPIGSPHNAAIAEEFFCGLILELEGDDLCMQMLDLYEKGFKSDEIAEELNVTPQEIYTANKRLKRKARSYLQKLNVAADNEQRPK